MAAHKSVARSGVLAWVLAPLLPGLAFVSLAHGAEVRNLEVDRRDGHIIVGSETFIGAPPAAVFEILADYEGFQDISDVFDETRFLQRDEQGNGLVYSRASGCVLFYCKTIERVERLTVEPGRKITAIAVPESSDVEYSVAHWIFEAEQNGTRVSYALDFIPDFWVPPILGPMILRSKLRSRGEVAADRVEELARALAESSDGRAP